MRLFRHKQQAPLSVLEGSVGGIADSAVISKSANSAASFQNLQTASKELNQYLQELDKVGGFTDLAKWSRNIEKTQSYPNSSFRDCVLEEKTLTLETRLLVDLAAKCSKAVYNKQSLVDLNPLDGLRPLVDLKSSAFVQMGTTRRISADHWIHLGGSMKETAISVFCDKELMKPDSQTVIVVAIRGTVILHDWMVNFNDTSQLEDSIVGLEFKDAENGLAQPVESNLAGHTATNSPYMIHAGFLACARHMTTPVAQKIKDTLDEIPTGKRPILVFTGHSAGGAIAALLYTHLLRSTETTELKRLINSFSAVHSFTFGAPPITLPALMPFNNDSNFLAFVNESDPIPRCDGPYLRSLLNLIASPMPGRDAKPWELPKPVLFNAGEVILIRSREPLILSKPKDSGAGSMRDTVMGNPRVHKMDFYLKKLKDIVETE